MWLKTTTVVGLFIGTVLFLYLIIHQGVDDLMAMLMAAGWGLMAVTAFHLLPLVAEAVAWRKLIRQEHRPTLAQAIHLRWICESVNGLLPGAYLGGELVRIRLAMRYGMPGIVAGMSTTLDAILGAMVQGVFSLVGIAALVQLKALPAGQLGLAVGLIATLFLLGLWAWIERSQTFPVLMERLVAAALKRGWKRIGRTSKLIKIELLSLLSRRGRLVSAGAWRIAGWMLAVGEVWLALRFLGHPVSLTDAFMLEIVTQAARVLAFAVPAGLGIQEASLMLLSGTAGLNPSVALALSLVKRIRDMLLGIPGLVAWQAFEGRQLWRRHLDRKAASLTIDPCSSSTD
jgi:putative membrane protein